MTAGAAIDMPYTAVTRSAIADWERDNPQHVHGKFVYSAHKFGLTPEALDNAFGD